ncbi:hypothetical protein NXY47_00090 [Bacteroides fragilis]|nr:hypothetical protein [Bacteroides fragilis]
MLRLVNGGLPFHLGEDVPIQLLPLEGSNGLSLQYDGEISTTKMLWTTANYSFFVRPGMKLWP